MNGLLVLLAVCVPGSSKEPELTSPLRGPKAPSLHFVKASKSTASPGKVSLTFVLSNPHAYRVLCIGEVKKTLYPFWYATTRRGGLLATNQPWCGTGMTEEWRRSKELSFVEIELPLAGWEEVEVSVLFDHPLGVLEGYGIVRRTQVEQSLKAKENAPDR
jgi:hypothetical protein